MILQPNISANTLSADALTASIKECHRKAAEEIGMDGEEYLKVLVGIKYPPASRAGSPPASRSGTLRDNIYHKVEDTGPALILEVGAPVAGTKGNAPMVPMWLEYGTARIAPRPFMRVAFDRATREASNILATALQ